MTRFRKITGRKWDRHSPRDNPFAPLSIRLFDDAQLCRRHGKAGYAFARTQLGFARRARVTEGNHA